MVVGIGFSLCALGCTDGQGRDSAGEPATQDPPRVAAPLPPPAFTASPIADVAERSVVSVVNISSEKVVGAQGTESFGPFFNDPFFRHFFGEGFRSPQVPRERRERSLGSGVIVSDDGIVLTNNHVIENAESVRVTLSDEREFEATIVGADPQTDLAVLRIEGDLEGVAPLPLGDSDRLRLGDVVLAIGNPFGVGQTVTMGIISAIGRANVGIVDYEDFIQTDAAINPGNSGGALVDTEGNLIGINTAIMSRSGGYQGIGFAVPSNMAKHIMESLVEEGRVVRGFLGVAIQDLTPELAESFGIEETRGVLIADVSSDSPAEAAGLEQGDVVVRFDGQRVDDPGRLRNLVANAGGGTKVSLDVIRDGEERRFDVELGELPTQEQPAKRVETRAETLRGLEVEPLNASTRRRFDIPSEVDEGVVIVGVAADSPASRAGLRPGDVILEVGRRRISSPDELASRLGQMDARTVLLISRRGNALYISIDEAQ
jgi:serine protease Do